MKFYDILKERRKKSGLSQAKLGKLIGSKESTVCNIEIGRTVPTDQTVWNIGAALCYSRSEIIESLKLADYHRKHRDEFEMEYVITSNSKRLKRIDKLS